MSTLPLDTLVPGHIKRFEAYIPSKPDSELKKLYGCKSLLRLNNNENPLGPPPAAQRVISSFHPPHASIYPSGDSFYLRQRLAEEYGFHPDRFIVGNGANEVIGFVIAAFCREGDNIVTADKTFAVYEWVARFSGFEARLVPLIHFGFDDNGLFEQIDDRTKVVFICNPNNPTGMYWNEDRLRRFLTRIDEKQIVVVDEAYCEFVDKPDFPDSIQLMEEFRNLVVFRTFSKMYALAGLRVGYLMGDQDVVDIIRRTCVVYSVNTLAQEAALAAFGDDEHIQRTRDMVHEGKSFLLKELEILGLDCISGEGNFIMVHLPINDSLAYRKLMTRGIMVRTMTGFRFPNFIRITISHMEAMEAFIEALSEIL
jgi:histidinol-phosphate aminotransferase